MVRENYASAIFFPLCSHCGLFFLHLAASKIIRTECKQLLGGRMEKRLKMEMVEEEEKKEVEGEKKVETEK